MRLISNFGLVFLVTLSCSGALISNSWHIIAQNVLDNLYATSSDYRFSKPALAFTSAKQDVAYFLPSKNTLVVEEEAFKVCSKLGKDSINALAFIIGHELAHLYQEEMRTGDFASSFLSYDKGLHARIRYEKQADIQGAFNAYVAGYQIKNIIPKLIQELYRSYNILDVTLERYPTLIERSKTAEEVSAIVEDLILLFDTAPYFSIIGAYHYAFSSYEYIGQYYRGGEVLNNLGLNYLLEAVNLTDLNIDRFAFPIEFNFETRLKKPKILYGAKDFDLAAFTKRIQLLEKAKKIFEESISQTKSNNKTALLNLASTLTLLGNSKEALDILLTTLWPDKLVNKAEILRSIILFDLDISNKQKSLEILKRISEKGNMQEQIIALTNIEIILNEKYKPSEVLSECNVFSGCNKTIYPGTDSKEISLNDASDTNLRYMRVDDVVYVKVLSTNSPMVIINSCKPDTSWPIGKHYNQGSIYSYDKGYITYCPIEKLLMIYDSSNILKRTITYKIGFD